MELSMDLQKRAKQIRGTDTHGVAVLSFLLANAVNWYYRPSIIQTLLFQGRIIKSFRLVKYTLM